MIIQIQRWCFITSFIFIASCGGGSETDSTDGGLSPDVEHSPPENLDAPSDIADREDLDELLSLDGRSSGFLTNETDANTPLWKCNHSVGLVSCNVFSGVSEGALSGNGFSWDINDVMKFEFNYFVSSSSSVDITIPEIDAEYGYFDIQRINEGKFTGKDTRGFDVMCEEVPLELCPYQDSGT
ncbi:MAG: hypothetical protein AB8B87_21025 [Granulosicoccus sp.]